MSFGSISHIYTLVFLLGQWCKPVVRSFRFCTELKLCEFNCKCVFGWVQLCFVNSISLRHNRLSAVTQYTLSQSPISEFRAIAFACHVKVSWTNSTMWILSTPRLAYKCNEQIPDHEKMMHNSLIPRPHTFLHIPKNRLCCCDQKFVILIAWMNIWNVLRYFCEFVNHSCIP